MRYMFSCYAVKDISFSVHNNFLFLVSERDCRSLRERVTDIKAS